MDTKKLRQKILDLAIHGKLVPQDPNDEPASVLLERIKAEKEQLIKEGKIKRQKKSTSSDTSHYGNDVPFEVPDGWVWCKVNDIALSILYGVSEPAKSHGQYKLLRITDIQNNSVNWNNVPYADFDTPSEYFLRSNDILFARTGATVGKSYLVEDVDNNCIYASYLIRIRCSLHIYAQYVKRFFESGFYWEQITYASVGVGQPNVNGSSLCNLMIPIPPIEEQKRIVDEVEKWFIQIDAIEQDSSDLKDTVQKAKSKILDLALSGRLTSHTSHYGKNEETLSETTLGNVCQLRDGEKITGKDYMNMDVKYLRGTKSGDMLHSGRFVPVGSLMILVDGENSGEVFTTPVDGYQGSTFKILDIDAKYCKEFILLLIQSNRKSLRENKVGSAIPHLNKKMFKEIVVPPFSYSEQCEIAQTVKDYFCVLDSIAG